MRLRRSTVALSLLPMAAALPDRSKFHKRAITDDASQIAGQAFDYVVVGGGLGGLVVANRLSEDSNVRVVVIEAGGNGDNVRERIDVPALAYYDGIAVAGAAEDWGVHTQGQPALNGRSLHWPRAKILGGNTAVNGLYMTRSTEAEHNAWSDLVGDREGWGWDAMLPYLRRFETLGEPSDDTEDALDLEIESSLHGHDGPIQISWPAYTYPQNELWAPTFEALGFPKHDPFNGNNIGGFITPSSIDPSTNTRSYAYSGYLAPVADRANLVVLTGHQVTRVLFDTSGPTPRATGVRFSAGEGEDEQEVTAGKEVVLSAGVIGTPHLLQLSGIGPRDVLEEQNITVINELPGVGHHIQDHLAISINFRTNTTTGGRLFSDAALRQAELDKYNNGQAVESLYSAPNNGVSYIDIYTLFGDETDAFLDALDANRSIAVAASAGDDTVKAGYDSTYASDVANVLRAKGGAVEVLLNNVGGDLGLQLAFQHPFSRGHLAINSTNPFELPTLSAEYFTHPADIQIIRQGLRFIRTLAATAPLSSVIIEESSPGADVSSDEDLEDFIRRRVESQYHPASSCAMLPRELGGVVDTQLKVYGVDALRIVDASVIPLPVAAHHMQPLYALSEKGADLIRGYQRASDSPSATSSENGALRHALANPLALLLATALVFFAF